MRILCTISLAVFFFLLACNKKCDYPVYFQVSFVEPGTKLQIDLDSGKLSETYQITDGFYMDKNKRMKIIEDYCSSYNFISVRGKINDLEDTIFIINRKEVKGCFIGTNGSGRLAIFYDYYEGGLREYRFDD